MKTIKQTHFRTNGKTIEKITEYAPQTRNKTKTTWFRYDGKTIYCIYEYDSQTGNQTKDTFFQLDGKIIDFIDEYDQNGNYLKTHHSNTDYVKNEQKKYK